jgi:hypothetical protein
MWLVSALLSGFAAPAGPWSENRHPENEQRSMPVTDAGSRPRDLPVPLKVTIH